MSIYHYIYDIKMYLEIHVKEKCSSVIQNQTDIEEAHFETRALPTIYSNHLIRISVDMTI